eukprot:TRINITY_DN50440_c0_g1_i1.p1 TRINITY_DN50440_c0_g1~~TRINITY_DN50440_c0_g1_i1.p1  ORF type:complete len:665 (+),score=89.95 TRINITY_DN50440_c0_g1_i1:36-1997(+)
MGCTSSHAVTNDGSAEICLPVPEMPPQGGPAVVKTPDGVTLDFFAPAGYPQGTIVRARYMPLPKAKQKARTKTKTVSAGAALNDPGASAGADAGSAPVVQQVDARIVHNEAKGLPILPAQLPKINGGWDWIRNNNDELHRMTRQDAAELLIGTFKKGGYSMKHENGTLTQIKFSCIQKMIKGTKLLSCGLGLPKLPRDPQSQMQLEHGSGITPMEKSQKLTDAGFKTACVNAASAYHAGGGFTSGGRHALEEAFCSQSTLYASLQQVQALWKKGETKGLYVNTEPGYQQHIPTDGCIVSPHVEIFRGNTDQGYFLHGRTVPLAAVVSVAMFNKNRRVRDAPIDAPEDAREYEDGVRKKFTAMLHGAALSGADAIIIPDVGCGVFQNDPKQCGRICGDVLFNYSSYFRRVVFTGKEEFYRAATEALHAACASGHAPLTADLSMRSCLTPVNEKAHLFAGNCVVCKRGLGKSDFSNLALLINKKHMSHQMEFLHDSCGTTARKEFPQYQVLNLPDVARDARSFLRALDLNGNGFVEKQELKCICALLWPGDVAKETVAFENDFEARFATWDLDGSGNVDLRQLTNTLNSTGSKGLVSPKTPKTPKSPKAAPPKRLPKGSISLESTPESCIEWIQAQAKMQALSNSINNKNANGRI